MAVNSVGDALQNAERKLAAGGVAAAHIDARVLLKHCMNIGDGELAARAEEKMDGALRQKLAANIRRRLAGEPAAYIIGRREFMGLDFMTTPAALAPRPETEELTETALAHILPGRAARALDLGAGCGAIGLSIARLRPQSKVLLADCSEDALALAQKNSARLNAPARFCQTDWFAGIGEVFDLIVANPPYIAAGDGALAALKFEPPLALCGGADGLQSLQAVVAGAPRHLRAGGLLLVEHGAAQENAVRKLFADAGFCGISCRTDLAGLPRMTFGVRPR
ncbi:MAG: peptide chain release factor N(5)-glutamine methyltransferase [Gammaproteobacteria bacterium]